jgi:hypothetical protein
MHTFILKNSLVTDSGLERLLAMPRATEVYSALTEIFVKFQEIKEFASEIHTETHLVKPVLKILGYTYESKPKFFEEKVKGPDVALFSSEEEMSKVSQFWGTERYFANTLGILLLKRYGRPLKEGVSGFYLDFENKIPLHQLLYMLKRMKTPWGILTNGKNWILIGRPAFCENCSIELTFDDFLAEQNEEVFHLFYYLFSSPALQRVLPEILDQERKDLIGFLKSKSTTVRRAFQGLRKRVDIYAKAITICDDLFPGCNLPSTEAFLNERGISPARIEGPKPPGLAEWNLADICSYLLCKKERTVRISLDEILLKDTERHYHKEDLLSLKVLDMTPGFGTASVQIADNLAHLSFMLPYRERNTFISEWENEEKLKRYIVDNLLFGIERSHVALDITRSVLKSHYSARGTNFRFGNPLIGMSIRDMLRAAEKSTRTGLFEKHPEEFMEEYYDLYRRFFSLSTKIKEDAVIREEISNTLAAYTEKIRDALDVMTASYFQRKSDPRKLQDMLMSLDGSQATWDAYRKRDWFMESREMARRNGFFHFEMEFPFLLNDAFDLIFVQPDLNYIWEEDIPLLDATIAYIKRSMPYLKPKGALVILYEHIQNDLIERLQGSKKYRIDLKQGIVLVRKATPS